MGCVPAIGAIAHDGVPDVFHMNTDLMRAPGLQPASDQANRLPAEHAIGHRSDVRDGPLAALWCENRHALTIPAVPAHAGIDRPCHRSSPHQGEIFPGDCPVLQLLHKTQLGRGTTGHHEQTAGVAIESMHDAASGKRCHGGVVRKQTVDQCAVRVSCRRMHHQTRRLVDNDDIRVLMNDPQIHCLRLPALGRSRLWRAHLQALSRAQCLGRSSDSPVDHDRTVLNPLLNSRSGYAGVGRSQHDIEALTVVLGRCLEFACEGRGNPLRFIPGLGVADSGGAAIIVRLIYEVIRTPMLAATHRFTLRLPVLLLCLAALILPLLSGCSSSSPARDETLGWSADKLYAEAKSELSASNWPAALKLLSKLESRYPFGRYAQQAQIDTAYAHWKEGEAALALAAIDRFLKLYPNHERLDYMLYLKGLINFNDRSSLFTTVTGEDLAERDPKASREAFDAFKELVTRFPNSTYADDASARMNFLINTLASNDVHVARFYLRRGAALAAVNRAQSVVRQYQQAPAIEEALAILVVAYQRLGLPELSADSRRVLEKNFPNSPYLRKPYDPALRGGMTAENDSFWNRFKFWK